MLIQIKEFRRRPELLVVGKSPRALYGVTPRSIMGEEAWNKLRKQVYKESSGRCACCGENPLQEPLEAHEVYDVDYAAAKCYLIEIVALCSLCHMMVHRDIHERSNHTNAAKFKRARMHCKELLREAGRRNYNKENTVPWYKWKLVWEGKEYSPKHEPY